MSELNNALMELPDSGQVESHLALIASDATECLSELYNQLAHGDTEGARQLAVTLNEKIEALQQFGQQATAIIDGLVAAVNVAVSQRNEAMADVREMRADFDEAVSDAVADVFARDDSITDAKTQHLARRIAQEGYDAVFEEEQSMLLDQMDNAEEMSFDYIVEDVPDAEEQD